MLSPQSWMLLLAAAEQTVEEEEEDPATSWFPALNINDYRVITIRITNKANV